MCYCEKKMVMSMHACSTPDSSMYVPTCLGVAGRRTCISQWLKWIRLRRVFVTRRECFTWASFVAVHTRECLHDSFVNTKLNTKRHSLLKTSVWHTLDNQKQLYGICTIKINAEIAVFRIFDLHYELDDGILHENIQHDLEQLIDVSNGITYASTNAMRYSWGSIQLV